MSREVSYTSTWGEAAAQVMVTHEEAEFIAHCIKNYDSSDVAWREWQEIADELEERNSDA